MPGLGDVIARIPPHDGAVERAVLGVVLLDGRPAWELVSQHCTREDFYIERHRQLWDAYVATAAADMPLDLFTVSHALHLAKAFDDIGQAYLTQVEQEAGLLSHVPGYAALLRQHAQRRALITLASNLIGDAYAATTPPTELLDPVRAYGDQALAPRGGFVEPISLAALDQTPPPEPAWLVQGLLLQAANGWIGAGAKVGKSYLALDLLLACCLGLPWLETFMVARPLTVVLVEEEDSAWRVYERARRLCRGRGIAMPTTFHVTIRSGLQLDEPASLDPFLRWLARRRADLVVWDVFNRLHTKNEKFPDQMLPILRRVDRIRDELGCANLIAHHARKPATTGPDLATGGQKLRGPSEFWGWAENSLYLAALKGKGVLQIEPESKDAVLEPFKVHLACSDCPRSTPAEELANAACRAAAHGRVWVYDGVVKARADKGNQTRQAILGALADGPLTAAQVAERIPGGRSEKTIKRHLSALAEDEAVESVREPGRAGRSLWMLTNEGGDAETPVTETDTPF